MLVSCIQKITRIYFADACRAPLATSEHCPTSLQYFLWGNFLSTDSVKPFSVWTWALSLSVQSGHTFHPPKGQQILSSFSHQFIDLCRLGSCYFSQENHCPKMPGTLLPFHILNQNWKLLSHSSLICKLTAACWAVLLWVIWRASFNRHPQKGWEHLFIHELWWGVECLCRLRHPGLEGVADFPLIWREAGLNCSVVFYLKTKCHLQSGCFKKHLLKFPLLGRGDKIKQSRSLIKIAFLFLREIPLIECLTSFVLVIKSWKPLTIVLAFWFSWL